MIANRRASTKLGVFGTRYFPRIEMQRRVLVALLLRDIKTRFFGSEFGFLISIAWPLSHILILLLLNTAIGRAVPYGESAALWFATGIVPFFSFSYMARFTMIGVVHNRPLLGFPIVKITDILFARAIAEILSAGVVILSLIAIFWSNGIEFIPIRPTTAFFAIGASMLLGLGVGFVNGVIAAAFPIWTTGYALLTIILWITSGVFFVAHALPQKLRDLIWLLPTVHTIEWMRSAYYEGYGDTFLDRRYLIGCALANLCAGLLLERLIRGRLLQN